MGFFLFLHEWSFNRICFHGWLGEAMADLPGYMRACLHTGKLAFLAILVSGGIVLQILVCALFFYNLL